LSVQGTHWEGSMAECQVKAQGTQGSAGHGAGKGHALTQANPVRVMISSEAPGTRVKYLPGMGLSGEGCRLGSVMIVLVHNVFVLQQTCRVKQHVDGS
jgi:hypothetical protein